jgi:hypothetical protein
VGPGGDDQRQAGVIGLADGQADQGVAFLLELALDQRLLQAVGEDHDPVVLAELAPDLLALGVRQQHGVGLGQETQAGQLAEVEPLLSVAQPHRHRDRPPLGQQLGQPDQQRRLARADPADDHVRAPGAAVAQVVDDHVAQLVAADDLADDASSGLHDLAWPVAGPAHERPVHPGVPPQQEHRRGQGEGEDGQQGTGQGLAGEVGVVAGRVEVDRDAAWIAGHNHVDGPGDSEEEDGRAHVDGDPRQGHPGAAAMPGAGGAGAGAALVGATRLECPGERPRDPGQQPLEPQAHRACRGPLPGRRPPRTLDRAHGPSPPLCSTR